jgi:hypothetical protein
MMRRILAMHIQLLQAMFSLAGIASVENLFGF